MRRISLLLTTTLAIVNGLRVLPSNSIIKNNNLKYYSSTILQSTEEKKRYRSFIKYGSTKNDTRRRIISRKIS